MIIACPACATRYAVPDSSIGIDGRVVRCAKCRHSWFQEASAPAEVSADPPVTAPSPWPENRVPPPATEPPVDAAPPGSAHHDPGHYDAAAQARDFADTPSSFAHEPPFRPRRNPATFWVIAAILLALVAVAAMAAVARFGVPGWLPLPINLAAAAQPDLVLDFPKSRQKPLPLSNGSFFFNVSGTIRNAGSERRAVPTLLILLRDTHRNIVYSLETASPKPVLAPGESETVNQAIIDAPSSAQIAEIAWRPH